MMQFIQSTVLGTLSGRLVGMASFCVLITMAGNGKELLLRATLQRLGMAIHKGQPVIVGQAGKAFKLSADGESWESLDSGTEERLLDIATLSDGSQIAVGAFGTIVNGQLEVKASRGSLSIGTQLLRTALNRICTM